MFVSSKIRSLVSEWRVTGACLALAAAASFVVLKWFSHQAQVQTVAELLIKLIPFFFALGAVTNIPSHQIKSPWTILLLLGNFAAMFCFFVPRLFFWYWQRNWDQYYLTSQAYVPFIILSLAFVFRLAGAKIKDAFVFGVVGILFMLSGIEDLAYILVNPHTDPSFQTIPETWWWASHMTIFVGHALSKYEAFTFIGIHFLLIALVLYVAYFRRTSPIGRSVDGVNLTGLASD